MEASKLAALIEESETHRLIVGDYEGPYALGVGRDPDDPTGYALLLKVPDAAGWPRSVMIHGQQIPVRVQGGFQPVKPLG